jgi:nitrite reductase/ring-hydroxylating ferredoxin subunit
MQKLDERLITTIGEQDWLDRAASSVQEFVRGIFSVSEAGLAIKDVLHGTWLAHPLHAVTTDVAIGAWTTAGVLDILDSANGREPSGASTAAVAVGLAGAAASAASGFADWSETSGYQKKLGIVHASLNVTAVLLYSGSLASRIAGSHPFGRVLAGLGFGTVLVSSYLGGDLAYRLGTQVDRNAWARSLRDFTPVMAEAELQPEKPTRVEAKGVRIMLVRQAGQIFALGDTCAHQGCSLAKGHLQGDTIVCSCHGSTYRLEDGTAIRGPAVYPQPSFEVRTAAGQIEVKSAAF